MFGGEPHGDFPALFLLSVSPALLPGGSKTCLEFQGAQILKILTLNIIKMVIIKK